MQDGTQAPRPSLLQRALGVFTVIALFLALFLWAGKELVQRPTESIYLDARRLAALQTFENAIVPLKSLRAHAEPTAELIRSRFEFCADPLKEKAQDKPGAPTARRSSNPCAGGGAPEEIACYLKAIDARLGDMTIRKNRERVLGERYVVDVERWAENIRAKQTPCRSALAAARHMAARNGRLLGLVSWKELSAKSAARQFAPDQALKSRPASSSSATPGAALPVASTTAIRKRKAR